MTNVSIQQRFKKLINYMSQGVYEKEQIMALALLSLVAEESIFLLGPPGTAKSLVARRLKSVLKDGKVFDYLMSRFSTPDEVFGPVSIAKLKNEDRYERITDGYLPSADIVFLDEIWKASPSIQNSLLTAINEKIFTNGSQVVPLPLKLLIAASNELPAENEGLEALWDRFLIRIVSNPVREQKNFFKMVCDVDDSYDELPENLKLTPQEIAKLQEKAKAVKVPKTILEVVGRVRENLGIDSDTGTAIAENYVSDRRWKKIFKLLRTSAAINGRDEVNYTDLMLLLNCLWNNETAISHCASSLFDAITDGIEKNLDKIQQKIFDCQKSMGVTGMLTAQNMDLVEQSFDKAKNFYYILTGYGDGDCWMPATEYSALRADSDTPAIVTHDADNDVSVIHPVECQLVGLEPMDASVKRVMVRKFIGGLVVDDNFYRFKTLPYAVTASKLETRTPVKSLITKMDKLGESIDKAIEMLDDVQVTLVHQSNLFVNHDDIQVVNKRIQEAMKRITPMHTQFKALQIKI